VDKQSPEGAFRLCASKRTEAPPGAEDSRRKPAPCQAFTDFVRAAIVISKMPFLKSKKIGARHEKQVFKFYQ